MRPRQLDHQRQVVGGRYRLDGDGRAPRRGRFTVKPADTVPSVVVRGQVVGGQLATGYRRFVVKEYVVVDLKLPCQRIRVLPALRQVAGQDTLGIVDHQGVDTAVDCPVRQAQSVQRRSQEKPPCVADPRVAVLNRDV